MHPVLGRFSTLASTHTLLQCTVNTYQSSMECDIAYCVCLHRPILAVHCPTDQSSTACEIFRHTFLQRRSRRSLALKRGTSRDMSHSANPSARRLSLEKAQSRKALGSQKALNTHQTLEGNGIANNHQKPTGTAVDTLADVETGQMHHGTTVDGTDTVKPSSNSGLCHDIRFSCSSLSTCPIISLFAASLRLCCIVVKVRVGCNGVLFLYTLGWSFGLSW